MNRRAAKTRVVLSSVVALILVLAMPSSAGILEADLEIEKRGELNPSTVVWTVTVTNFGPDDAVDVLVTDPLDACTTYISDDCDGNNLPPWTWFVAASLPRDTSVVCNITVDASACGSDPLFNTATVTSSSLDPVTGNQTATAIVFFQVVAAIPTLGGVGMFVLMALLALGAFVLMRRRTA